jgi:hypothetical protein
MERLGGTLRSLHHALRDTDTYAIAELPDDKFAVAGPMIVRASGVATISVKMLLTPVGPTRPLRPLPIVDYRPSGH